MHGLGADGHDFADVAALLANAARPRRWRFVLPHAPEQPVTINMGMRMPAWYDILDLEHPRSVNWQTITDSQLAIEELLTAEAGPQVVLAGFSQGAALALHIGLRNQARIAGVLMMSGYLLEPEGTPCPEKEHDFPIGIFHGAQDPVVPLESGELASATLAAGGYSQSLKIYDDL